MRQCLTTLILPLVLLWGVGALAGDEKDAAKVQLLREYDSEDMVTVWIYFSDKGGDRVELAKFARISDKALARRAVRATIADADYYDREVSDVYVEQISSLVEKTRQCSRWLNAVSAEVKARNLPSLADLAFVSKITEVAVFRRQPLQIEDGVRLRRPGDDNPPEYGDSYFQLAQIGVTKLHSQGLTGAGVTILMLDTGYHLLHPVFANIDIDSTWDFINGDVDVEDPDSLPIQQRHGTATLSLIGGYAVGDLIGAAYGASFLLAKTERQLEEIEIEEDAWVAGLEWGEALGADIASSSLGYYFWYEFEDMDGNTAVTTVAADIAAGLGVIVCNSQGNVPASFVMAPADGDSVIAVGAVTKSNSIWASSVHGPTADGRIKPDVCALGSGAQAASYTGGYTPSSGTSMSCPLVAGAVALLLESHPDWDYGQIYWALIASASKGYDPDNVYGYGIIDAAAANGSSPIRVNELTAAPNPCKTSITFGFPMKESGVASVTIFTVAAEKVIKIQQQVPGGASAQILWDLRNREGEEVANGIYIAYIKGPGISETIKFLKVTD